MCQDETVNERDPSTQTGANRILRYSPERGRWRGVLVEQYKPEKVGWSDIRRMTLVGLHGETTRFHLRYFEIGPGGRSSLEHHRHEHVVIAFRGKGEILLDGKWEPLEPGDVAYTAPGAVHQLRAPADSTFGFFCIVDAERDAPVVVPET